MLLMETVVVAEWDVAEAVAEAVAGISASATTVTAREKIHSPSRRIFFAFTFFLEFVLIV